MTDDPVSMIALAIGSIGWICGYLWSTKRRRDPRRRHWRVSASPYFSWNADYRLFFVEYRTRLGLWRQGFSEWAGFKSNDEAVAWISKLEPLSIFESSAPVLRKPDDWELREHLSGRYGKERQNEAIDKLARRIAAVEQVKPAD